MKTMTPDLPERPGPGSNSSERFMETDYSVLLDPATMAHYIGQRRILIHRETEAMRTILETLDVAIRSATVHGDGRFSARRRARRTLAPVRKALKGLETALGGMQAIPSSMADYTAQMEVLPAQRQAKAERRLARRDAVAELTGKSLHKTTTHFSTGDGTAPEARSDGQGPQNIHDLWRDQRGA